MIPRPSAYPIVRAIPEATPCSIKGRGTSDGESEKARNSNPSANPSPGQRDQKCKLVCHTFLRVFVFIGITIRF